MRGLLPAVLLVFLVAGYEAMELTAEQKEKLKEHFKVCSESSGVSIDALAKTQQGEFPTDPKMNKFFGCMYKRIGLQDDKGNFQMEVMKAKMPKEVKGEDMDKLVAACKDVKGADSDETAYLLYKCYHEKSPQHVDFY